MRGKVVSGVILGLLLVGLGLSATTMIIGDKITTGTIDAFLINVDSINNNLAGFIGFNDNRLSNVLDPVEDQDAVTKGYLESALNDANLSGKGAWVKCATHQAGNAEDVGWADECNGHTVYKFECGTGGSMQEYWWNTNEPIADFSPDTGKSYRYGDVGIVFQIVRTSAHGWVWQLAGNLWRVEEMHNQQEVCGVNNPADKFSIYYFDESATPVTPGLDVCPANANFGDVEPQTGDVFAKHFACPPEGQPTLTSPYCKVGTNCFTGCGNAPSATAQQNVGTSSTGAISCSTSPVEGAACILCVFGE